jgi:hypothetical protein
MYSGSPIAQAHDEAVLTRFKATRIGRDPPMHGNQQIAQTPEEAVPMC